MRLCRVRGNVVTLQTGGGCMAVSSPALPTHSLDTRTPAAIAPGGTRPGVNQLRSASRGQRVQHKTPTGRRELSTAGPIPLARKRRLFVKEPLRMHVMRLWGLVIAGSETSALRPHRSTNRRPCRVRTPRQSSRARARRGRLHAAAPRSRPGSTCSWLGRPRRATPQIAGTPGQWLAPRPRRMSGRNKYACRSDCVGSLLSSRCR